MLPFCMKKFPTMHESAKRPLDTIMENKKNTVFGKYEERIIRLQKHIEKYALIHNFDEELEMLHLHTNKKRMRKQLHYRPPKKGFQRRMKKMVEKYMKTKLVEKFG